MTLRRCRTLGALVVALGLAIAGCGGSGEPDRFALTTPKTESGTTPPVEKKAPVTDAERRVIRGWSEKMRDGDVKAAAKFFSVPALVSISEEDELDSERRVEDFNDSFPCGARLIHLQRTVDRLVLADFELTDRPGGACDSVGTRATFAFLIDADEHIARLIMVPAGDADPGPDAASAIASA